LTRNNHIYLLSLNLKARDKHEPNLIKLRLLA